MGIHVHDHDRYEDDTEIGIAIEVRHPIGAQISTNRSMAILADVFMVGSKETCGEKCS
jgi:hypothetical protein